MKLRVALIALSLLALAGFMMFSGQPQEREKVNKPNSQSASVPTQKPVSGLSSTKNTMPAGGTVQAKSPTGETGKIQLLPVTSGRKDAEGYEVVDWSAGKPHYEGEPVVAQVTTGKDGRKLHLEVNQMGEYPRVQVEAGEIVKVRMQFQRSPAEMPLALTAQDGGGLAGGKPSQSVRLASDRSASFDFTAGQNVGVHRVTVATPSGEIKTFDFWVGPLNIMRTTAQR